MEYLQKISTKRAEKVEKVNLLNQKLIDSTSAIVIRPEGLTVEEETKIRKTIRRGGGTLVVTKNTLVIRAIKDTKFQSLDSFFSGPTAIVYSTNGLTIAKDVTNFAKDNEKVKILGGVIDGKFFDVESVKAIATLPPLDELRAKLISLINTPATNIAGVTKAPLEKLVRVFGAYSSKE